MACVAIVVRRYISNKGLDQITPLLNVLIGESFISVGASIKPSGGIQDTVPSQNWTAGLKSATHAG
jgi:hypothetical protein